MARSKKHGGSGPSTGKLEQDVDAILLAHGLELNAPVDRVLSKSRRTPKPFGAKKTRPTQKKRLREARRRGGGPRK